MKKLRVTTIQTALYWEDIDANLAHFEPKILSVAGQTDVILLPEMFSTGFTNSSQKLAEPINGKTGNWLMKMAKATGAVVAGSFITQDDNNYFNCFCWTEPDGTRHIYNKHHLFTHTGEHEYYSEGKEKVIIPYKGWNICPQICYDLRFPEWSRNLEDYDLLIFVANWPNTRKHHWKALLMARAIENQVYTMGVNIVGEDGVGFKYSGDSSVITYAGDLLYTAAGIENIATVELDLEAQKAYRNKFKFLQDRDQYKILFN